MLKFAANLSMMFTEQPFLERFTAAADAGFSGVEFLFPYAYDAADLAQRLHGNGLTQVLFNMPPGDWERGERGIACLPDRSPEFRAGVTQALNYAKALNCQQIHAMAGLVPPGLDASHARATYVENLRFAAHALAPENIRLLIEPINTQDMPGYLLTGTRQALGIIAEVNCPNISLQYDCYHMHIMEGGTAAALAQHLPEIAHIQIADAPGRHEPGTGDIDYPALFAQLDSSGYAGWIGCEYRPKVSTRAGLSWLLSAGFKPGVSDPDRAPNT